MHVVKAGVQFEAFIIKATTKTLKASQLKLSKNRLFHIARGARSKGVRPRLKQVPSLTPNKSLMYVIYLITLTKRTSYTNRRTKSMFLVKKRAV